MALGGCNYEDGPVLSLRGKVRRMSGLRSIVLYEHNGIDSTEALNQIFMDSLGGKGFKGEFYFTSTMQWDAYYLIEMKGANEYGSWTPTDDFERLYLVLPPAPFVRLWQWRITRLTNYSLWLEGPDGRILHFKK